MKKVKTDEPRALEQVIKRLLDDRLAAIEEEQKTISVTLAEILSNDIPHLKEGIAEVKKDLELFKTEIKTAIKIVGVILAGIFSILQIIIGIWK